MPKEDQYQPNTNVVQSTVNAIERMSKVQDDFVQNQKQRAMRYHADMKDTVAAYRTAMGNPTKGIDFDDNGDWFQVSKSEIARAINYERMRKGLNALPVASFFSPPRELSMQQLEQLITPEILP